MNNDWLDIDVLEDYLDGKLDAKAMHFVERQALEDPFVAEALEGLKQSPKRKQTLSILQKQLHDRIAEKPIKRKLWGITTHRLSIAATATVAFIAVSILFFMRETNRRTAETAVRRANGVIVDLDTNEAIAKVAPKRNDTILKPEDGVKSAVIDQAIAAAKTSALAKNRKTAAPKIATVQTEIAEARAEQSFSESTAPLLLKAKAVSAAPAIADKIVYSGNVVDQRDGQPVEGAVVKLAGSNKVTATNANGYFALPADSAAKSKDLVINAIGFKEMPVDMQDPSVISNALSGNKSINEIAMITGSNGRKKENIAAPKIILRADQNLNGKLADDITKPIPVQTVDYKQYLEGNNKLYNPQGPEEFVILSFEVKKNGRPAKIKVIKSLNKKADDEARRLVQTGPDWILPKNGYNKVELSVKF